MRIECVERVSPAEKHAIIELLGTGDFKSTLWDWQFHRQVGERRRILIVAYDDDGQVVGFNGSLPISVKLNGSSSSALWSCDFIVSAASRGKGIGHMLKQDLLTRADSVMALGLSSTADRVHASMGWKRGPSVGSFTRLNDMRSLRSAIKVGLQHLQSFWLRARPSGSARQRFTASVTSIRTLGEEVEQLWEAVRTGYENVVVRDWTYVNWRYAEHPMADYRAICVRDAEHRLRAMGIFWMSSRRAVLVDYIGPRAGAAEKQAIVLRFLKECRSAPLLECSTTDSELQHSLAKYGFVNWRNRAAAFNYYDPHARSDGGEWFLMGGDSDGDMLEAGRSADEFRVERWDESMFARARNEWTDLLNRSTADRLFLSWEWLHTWWQTFGGAHGLELRILAVRERSGRLVGVAPLYLHRATQRNFASRRMQFIGNIWRGAATMRTEYLEFVLDTASAAEVARVLCNSLIADRSWDDLVLTDLPLECATRKAVESSQVMQHCYLRVADSYTGYGIDTSGVFDEYVSRLSASRRRKLFVQRRKLEKQGAVVLETLPPQDFEGFAARLDRLHRCRWGKDFFVGRIRRFHAALLAGLPPGASAHLSVMTLNGMDVSAAYNVRVGTREYNLQGGFDEQAVPSVSLGLVHTGYLIEQAFREGIECLDLLVGGGKQHDFKARIADAVRRTATLHVVRAPLLQAGFRLNDAMKRQGAR
ncbi:GNAT family N-acetyltransferase [Peristeroidobacter agariperforans]|uniref:GNAT family N-acetyltransferase n=1 Tax=Peristeroidobacter agariperforans TaxID=268404 RepID=UPI00101D3A25|nr:GNAT family N-acetyltransferase [Peristeroidobacter agariperforans]